VQLQQAPIPQPPQDLTGAKGIETHEAAQAGVVHLGASVRLEQRPELLVAEILSTDAGHEGTDAFAKGGGVAQHHAHTPGGGIDTGRGQKRIGHLGKHAWDAFALITGEAEIHQGAHQAGVAAAVHAPEAEQFIEAELRKEATRAGHFHAVVEQPHFDAGALNAVVAMGDRVEQGFLPGESRVFAHRPKAVAHQP
jgi:hypothetical protein